jgi:ankyrin repeat protein/beta-lactamase regulating signal transducer with metallopeptidase domain
MDLALIVKITIVLLVGLSAAGAARRARASVRHLILAATFAALLALPTVPSVLPDLEVAVPSAKAAITAVVPDVSLRETATRIAGNVTVAAAPPAASRVSLATWLTLMWATGAVLLTGLLTSALLKLRGLRRNGIPWDRGQATLEAIARESGLTTAVEVLRHDAIGAPVTWGVRHPVVLLPADAPEWDERDLRQAFLHELEHVHRRDWLVQVAARAVCAVYWFHPLVWVAWRQLCLESERACDDAVLRRADGADYAQQLVSLAQRVSVASTVPMLSMAGRSDLSVRVRALLDTTIGRGRAGRRTLLGASLLAAAIVLALSPLRAAQPVNAVDSPPDMTKVMEAATLLDTTIDAIEMKAESLQDSVVDTLRGRQGRPVSRDLIEAFLESAGDGDVDRVEGFLSSGMDVNTLLLGDGTPLMAAAQHGKLEMVRLLIGRGADVNLPAKGDGNPLIVASRAGQRAIVSYLLDQGADVNATVEGDGTPLIVAARKGDLDMVRLLVARGADVNVAARGDGNPLIVAAMAGQLPVVRYLVDQGAQIEAIVEGDENPLINAAGHGHLDVVRFLVERGANVNAGVWVDTTVQVNQTYQTTREYRSPLSMATKGGHRAVVDFLRANGAVN